MRKLKIALGLLAILLLALGLGGIPSFGQTIIDSRSDPTGQAMPVAPPSKPVCVASFDVTGYTTPTDIFSITGSATKTVRILRLFYSAQATAGTQADMALIKRSTANTGGTPTTITNVPLDSRDSACTATVVTYAAAPTTGTLVGNIADIQFNMAAAGQFVGNPPMNFMDMPRPPTLRGTSEVISGNWFGAAWPAGGKISVTLWWVEE